MAMPCAQTTPLKPDNNPVSKTSIIALFLHSGETEAQRSSVRSRRAGILVYTTCLGFCCFITKGHFLIFRVFITEVTLKHYIKSLLF